MKIPDDLAEGLAAAAVIMSPFVGVGLLLYLVCCGVAKLKEADRPQIVEKAK